MNKYGLKGLNNRGREQVFNRVGYNNKQSEIFENHLNFEIDEIWAHSLRRFSRSKWNKLPIAILFS